MACTVSFFIVRIKNPTVSGFLYREMTWIGVSRNEVLKKWHICKTFLVFISGIHYSGIYTTIASGYPTNKSKHATQ